jgi:CitB family two-component system sensor histidine kinase CitS
MNRVSLQTKILVLIIGLILFIVILLTGIIAHFESEETEEQMGGKALQAATTLSFMPTIIDAFDTENPEETIQQIVQQVRERIGAEFITVGNKDSIRYAHPDPEKIGKKMVGGDNDRALINGEYYTSKAVGSLGPSLRGKAPIFNKEGDIIGIVSVGFLVDEVESVTFNKMIKVVGASSVVLLIGIVGGILLARDIRKETLGLEPHEIASLYRDRNAILSSVKEGIIAMDQHGYINMVNESAQTMLGLSEEDHHKKMEDVIPNTKMYDVLYSGEVMRDEEMLLNNRHVIVNRTPIIEKEEVIGVVASFRDKTELNDMINTLSEVRKYSEDLRAQTHEYTNKLYVLSGLLQLKHYDEAIELIQTESHMTTDQNKVLLKQIKDQTVQAILLGKIGRASEKKINFMINPNSSLEALPKQFDTAKLITILGNLLDNAIEAVETQKNGQIEFFAVDVGVDIVFEITDNGDGISEEMLDFIFTRGFSTKQKENRGYGLSIVKETIDQLNGQMEIYNQSNGGAVFSVFIPKGPSA